MNRLVGLALPLLIAVAFLAGCGPSNPKTYKVTGVVTYKGAPVEGANVSFMVDGAARQSSGMTDAQGKYTLTTWKANDGAHPGENKVTVTKVEAAGPMKPEDMAKAMAPGGGGVPKPKSLIPEKYGTPASPLSAKVEPGGKNEFNFELVD